MKYVASSMFSRSAASTSFPCERAFRWSVCAWLIVALIGRNAPAAPANDDINDATVVPLAPYTNSVDTTSATVASDDPYSSCGVPNRTVWYEYSPAQDVQIEANTFGSGYDTVLSGFTGARGNLSMLACNDDTIGTQSEISFTAQAGELYYFMIGSYGTNGGALVFSLRESLRPVNDDFSNVTVISALPFTNNLDTTSASTGAEDPYYCYSPSRTVWYSLMATRAERIKAGVAASDYHATLAVLTGAPGKFIGVACGVPSQVIFDAIAGQTYYFLAGAMDANAGHLVLTVEEIVPPPNDDFSNATHVTSLPYTDMVNTATASVANDDPYACITPNHTVWYALTPNQHTRVEANISGTNVGAISVFTGSRGALNQVACSSGTDSQQGLSFDAEAGQTYHVLVGSSGDGGVVVFSFGAVLPPPNDDIDNAIAVSALPFSNVVNIQTATPAPDDPISCGQFDATVWYLITPTQDMFISGEFQSGFPLQMALYSGTRGALHLESCNSAGFAVQAGRTYYLLLGTAQGTVGGQVSFTLRDYPLFKIGLSVNSAGSIDSRTGLATVRGTVTSSEPVTVFLSGTITQKSGRFRSTSASIGNYPGFVPVPCPGEAAWSVQVMGESIPFGAGAALVSLTAVAFEPASSQQSSVQVSQTIQLKGAKK